MKDQYPNPYNCGYWAASMKFKRIPPNGPGQNTEEWRRKWFEGFDSYNDATNRMAAMQNQQETE